MHGICPTLNRTSKQIVDFNPKNRDHLEAFRLLCLGEVREDGTINIKQHPTMRFHLETPFTDIRSLMFHKVGEAHIKLLGNVALSPVKS